MKTRIISIVIATVLMITLLTTCGYERVDSGHAGILVKLFGDNKGVQDVSLITGGQFYNKWTEEVYEFPTFVQHTVWANNKDGVNEEFSVTTFDGMSVTFDVGFDYQVISERVPEIFKKYRKELSVITSEFLRTAVRNSYNEIAGQYDADSLLSRRNDFERKVKLLLIEKIKVDFIVAQLGIVGDIRVPEIVRNAINDKVLATQKAQQRESEKRTIIAEAQKNIEMARGDSTAKVITANGNALATKIHADATAYANRQINQTITQQLIDMKKIETWNGILPTVTGGAVPFINLPK